MSIRNEESMDKRISRTVCKAFEQLIHDLKNEPTLILESGNQLADGENTLGDIGAWLFKRRQENGDTSN